MKFPLQRNIYLNCQFLTRKCASTEHQSLYRRCHGDKNKYIDSQRFISNSIEVKRVHQMQTLVHPRAYVQLVQLTDGSKIKMLSFSGEKSFIRLNVDSISHPSWNPHLREKMMLSEHGQVSRFNNRYQDDSGMDDKSLDEMAQKMKVNGKVGKLMSIVAKDASILPLPTPSSVSPKSSSKKSALLK